MNLFIQSPTRPSRPAHSWELLPMLGVARGGHLPAAGLPVREVQGIKVWVTPSSGEALFTGSGRRWHSSAHRVMCSCPVCGKEVSAGRLAQHSVVHGDSL